MKRRHILFGAALLPLLMLTACSDSDLPTGPAATAPLAIRLQTTVPDGSTSAADGNSDPESAIHAVTGYRFEDGILREVIPGVASIDGEIYTFSSSAQRGELRLAVNAGAIEAMAALAPETTTLETFLGIEASLGEMTHDGLAMTGLLSLDAAASGTRTVNLRRSMARIDLLSRDAGVEVHSVTIRRVADRGYFCESEAVSMPAGARRTDFLREFGDRPLVNAREKLLYLCEQPNDGMEVEVVARFDGGWHRLRNTLPANLIRNTVYTLEVYGRGAQAGVEVTAGSWDEGVGAESRPVIRGLVDVENSELSDGVRVNEARDTVYIPHYASNLRLMLQAEAGSTVAVDGQIGGVTVTPQTLTRGLEQVAAVAVSTSLRMPGSRDAYIGLTFLRDGVSSGRVVLVVKANPVRIQGLLTLDEEGVCDFGRYIEGELARISAPEGVALSLEFGDDESRWMNLVADGGDYRLLGGWKPNDPRADGREQEGFLVITDASGRHPERYTIRRRNWGLPVVNIGGTWWCKYNLRGNVKRYEDQVPISADPAPDAELADYLASCDDTELLGLLGDQYQAGNPNGLPLRHNGSAFYYEGMAGSGQNFGTIDPTTMAPYGYQVPAYADYAFFSRNENYNIGGIGERSYLNAANQEITVRVQERGTEFFGYPYGTIAIYEFRSGGGVWVLVGLGHQWDTTPGNIARMMLLMATYGNGSKTWIMEGYANADRPGQNWLKYVANNSTKTRVLRCVKTPVEYMYE